MELQELVERIERWKQRQSTGDNGFQAEVGIGGSAYAEEPAEMGEGDREASGAESVAVYGSPSKVDDSTREEEVTQSDEEESTAIDDADDEEPSDAGVFTSANTVSDEDIVSADDAEDDDTDDTTEEFPIDEVIDMTEEK